MVVRGSKKTYRVPLKPEWADALLAAPSADGTSIATRLAFYGAGMAKMVRESQDVIDHNPLTPTVASAAARLVNRRGQASIIVDVDGMVMLEIGPATADPTGHIRKPSGLPSLKSLREEAQALGIPTDRVGRNKRLLMAAIETVKAAGKGNETPVKKTRKPKSPVETPETVAAPDLPYPLTSELPEDLLSDT